MNVVSHTDTYAAIRNDISEKVEVFIDASFNVQAKKSENTEVGLSVGWSMLDKHGSFSGYGVVGIKSRIPTSPELAELQGILQFFHVMQHHFRYSYNENTKFIIRNDNLSLMLFLDDISRYGIAKTNAYSKETADKVSSKKARIDKMIRDFNVEFQWVKGHTDNHFNNLADELAYACFISERKGIPFVGELRTETIKQVLKNFHHATGGHFNRFAPIDTTIGSVVDIEEGKLERLLSELKQDAEIVKIPAVINEKPPKKAVTYPQIINDDNVYSAFRYPLKNTVEVFINSSYDLEYGDYDPKNHIRIKDVTDKFVGMGVGWAFLNDSREFSGYGVFKVDTAPTQSAVIADLRGILAVFDFMEKAFYDVYDEQTKFIVYSGNQELIHKLSRFVDKSLSPIDAGNREFKEYIRTLTPRLKAFTRTWDLEFRWKDNSDVNNYGNFAAGLASQCHQTSKEGVSFNGNLRMESIKNEMNILKSLTLG